MRLLKLDWSLLWAGLGYGAFCLVSVNFTALPGNFAIFWPANGFFLGWFLSQEKSPKILSVFVPTLVSFICNYFLGLPFLAALGFAGANGVEIVTAIFLIRRLTKSTDFIRSVDGMVAFYGLVCFLAAALGALIGSTTLFLVFHGPFFSSWLAWMLIDAAGMAIAAPAVITLMKSEYAWESSTRKRLEFLTCTAFGGMILILAFLGPEVELFQLPKPTPYLVIPVLVWSGVRFGMRGVSSYLWAVYGFATWATVNGNGPFLVSGPEDIGGLLSLHLFPLAAAVSSLAPAVLLDSQKQIAASLKYRDSRYGGLWNSKLIGVYITDFNGNIREANDTFLALIGKSRKDLVAGNIKMSKMSTPEYQATAFTNRDKFLTLGQIGPFERDWVLDDAMQLQQVLINLVGNAVKFSSSGMISLGFFLEEKKDNLCRIRAEVSDQGPGIPSEFISELFDAFRQGDASLSRHAGGTGLGLAICKEIVQRMGGKIWVDGSIGKGSRFCFTVELTISQEKIPNSNVDERIIKTLAEMRKSLNWVKAPILLVVDDHPVNLIVAAAMLQRMGCKVDTVPDGKSALMSVGMKSYDLVFMDCQMPDMDGFETTRKIRALEKPDTHLPIVALTAQAVSGDREKCITQGMDDYVAKPFTDDDLKKVLRRWIGSRMESGDKNLSDESLIRPMKIGALEGLRVPDALENSGIEWKRLARLDDGTQSGLETVLELLQLFMDSSQVSLLQIKEYFEKNSHDSLKQVLHKLKGSCGTIGAVSMHQCIRNLENNYAQNDREAFVTEFENLENLFLLACSEFRRKYPDSLVQA